MDDYQSVLDYWFGRVESTIIPSPNRNEIWFGNSMEVDKQIKNEFGKLHEKAINNQLEHWQLGARSSLALVIILDQFSRHIHRNTPLAFEYDDKALQTCLYGIDREMDHQLSMIERVFYYFPLIHSEDIEMQATGVQGYQLLVELALSETRGLYEDFLNYAVKHYKVIQQFGRFPHRNQVLGRQSTEQEKQYLEQQQDLLDD